MLNQREEWQEAFGGPSAAFDARIQQTLNHLEEGKPVKKMTARTAMLVLVLILALTGVVYAATGGWTIGDYFNSRYGGSVNAPEGFDSGYRQEDTQEMDGLTFRIRDAYVEGGILNAIVEISRSDGKPALFLGADCMEEDPIGSLYSEMDPDDPASLISVAQYAREKGLPVHRVSTALFTADNLGSDTADCWMEGETRLGYFVSSENVKATGDHVDFVWKIYTWGEDGALHQAERNVTLPVAQEVTWDVPVGKEIAGLPVILDTLHITQGRMGLYLDLAWHLEPELDPEKARMLQQGDINLWFRAVDPETGDELPGGPTVVGSVDSPDDLHYQQTGDSISSAFTGDTLYLQPYDAWEKDTFGLIEVKIK